MFQSGMDPRLGTGFMVATMMIALPSAVKVFNWLGTIFRGNLQLTTPMLFALSFVALFIIGGLSGIFGAIYYWFPKMFGRMMSEPLGKVHFLLTFTFLNATFFPMHLVGIMGLRRRIADVTASTLEVRTLPLNQFMSICALILGVTQLIFIVNFFWSLFLGPRAGRNPWGS